MNPHAEPRQPPTLEGVDEKWENYSALAPSFPVEPMGGAAQDPETNAQGLTPPGSAPRAAGRWDIGFIGLLIYLFVEYMSVANMFPALQILMLGKTAVLLALIGYFAAPRTQRRTIPAIQTLDLTLIALVMAVAVSSLFAEFRELAWNGTIDVLRWALIYFVISRGLMNEWRMKLFTFVWLLLNFKLAQFVVRNYLFYRSLPGMNEMRLITNGVGAAATGFFANAADLGVGMCVIWPVSIALLFSKPSKLYKLLLLASSGITLVAILVCGSRGAVVGAVVVALLTWVKSPRKVAAFMMGVLLLIGISLILPEASKTRFRRAEDPEKDFTAHHRLLLWRAGLQMFRDNPVLGVGKNNYPAVRRYHYPLPDWRMQAAFSVPHSLYIEGIAELGLAGSIPILLLWLLLFRTNTATRRHLLSLGPEQRRSFEFNLATGLDLGLIGYLASGSFVAVLWYPHIWVLLGLTAGLHYVALQKGAAPSGGMQLQPKGEPLLSSAQGSSL